MFARYKNYLLIAVAVVLVAAIASGSYYFGTQKPKLVIVKGIDNIENGQIRNVNFGTFWQTWELIKENYLKADEIKDQDLVYGSASGLVQSLGDPYSVFLPPEDSRKFKDDIKGVFGGIGAEIGVRGDFIVIVSPLKDSPAERAGLKPGDKIIKVDDESVLNTSVDEVVKMIRGPQGTEVTLTILHNGGEKTKEVKIIRDIIKVPTLEWRMKDGNIAHLQLYNFNEVAPRLIVDALNDLLRKGAKGMVFDLRNNPGGFLEVAVAISGIFIENGKEVVTEEFRSGKRDSFLARGTAALKDFPMVILLNKGSASASEILAGALRYHNNIPIVGEKSFGKGTVQELKTLPDGSTLKITVAHWVLPNGDIIEGNGIAPDVEVEMTEEDVKAEHDSQLEKAIEILKTKL